MTGERPYASATDRPGLVARTMRAASEYVAELFADLLNGLAALTPLALLAGAAGGCDGPDARASASQPIVVDRAPVAPPAEPAEPGPIGEFDVTFYYVASEEEVAAKIAKDEAEAVEAARVAAAEASAEPSESAETGSVQLAAIAPAVELPPREIVPLYMTKTCEVLAEVDKEFARQVTLQGTGKLKDGRLVNVANRADCPCDRKPCFHIVENQTWGTAGTGKPLAPFRTIAVDPKLIKLGSLLYVPVLEGRTMPGRAPWGGFVHDGCVVADDTGGGIKGFQIDLFVGRKGWYLGLSGRPGSHAWARHVPVYDGSKLCERKGRRIGRKAGAI